MNAQPQSKESHGKKPDYYTDMPVGEILRRSRVHYGQSLNDVESVLRIRASQLGAIESGKLDELPGRVYAIGFVRAYAEYLGLDGDKMVNLFKIQSVGNRARPELNFPVPASETKLPGVFLLVASLAAVLFIIILFSIFGSGHSKSSGPEEIPPVSPQLKSEAQAPVPTALPAPTQVLNPALAPSPAATGPLQAAPAMPGAPAQPVPRVVINIKDNTWVEIRNSSGKAVISQVLNPGDVYIVPNEAGMILATGNIGGLEFVVDGQHIQPLGNRGDVARGIKLDPDLLKPGAPRISAVPKIQAGQLIPQTPAQQPQPANPANWQSAIKPLSPPKAAAPVTVPPQPTPVHTPRRLKPEDEAFRPTALPGTYSGTTH